MELPLWPHAEILPPPAIGGWVLASPSHWSNLEAAIHWSKHCPGAVSDRLITGSGANWLVKSSTRCSFLQSEVRAQLLIGRVPVAASHRQGLEAAPNQPSQDKAETFDCLISAARSGWSSYSRCFSLVEPCPQTFSNQYMYTVGQSCGTRFDKPNSVCRE